MNKQEEQIASTVLYILTATTTILIISLIEYIAWWFIISAFPMLFPIHIFGFIGINIMLFILKVTWKFLQFMDTNNAT